MPGMKIKLMLSLTEKIEKAGRQAGMHAIHAIHG